MKVFFLLENQHINVMETSSIEGVTYLIFTYKPYPYNTVRLWNQIAATLKWSNRRHFMLNKASDLVMVKDYQSKNP